MAKAKPELTIEDLLAMGMSIEDIITNKKPESINVNFDTREFTEIVSQVAAENSKTLALIKGLMEDSQKQSKQFMNKSIQLLAKQVADSNKPGQKEIKGIKVVRNKNRLIDRLQFER